MDSQDEPEQSPTLAGRALRALQSQRAAAADPVEDVAETPPVEAPPVEAPPVEAPPAVEPEPVAATPAIDLTKTGEPDDASEPESEAGPTARRRNPLLVVSAGLLVLALAFAVLGLVVFLHGKDAAGASTASARDDVLAATQIDVATLTTLDYRSVKPGLMKWLAVTTGDFNTNIKQAVDSESSIIAKAKRITVGKVVAAAVTDLDVAKGTATVIASVEVTKSPAGQTSTVDRNRYRASMQKVAGVWKVANLEVVSVTLS